ncbi:polysaccharide biosynthesis/export family protein [Sphingomonas sp.]|uniref:polysaccharide biosynthesis/export family protein n=1 Tax=Sphingomonas sp. TaxID=28214 RepID=UPI00286EACC6|nr:polysaccharide biosynthesis/export family protein [Sphingomonas sp.]
MKYAVLAIVAMILAGCGAGSQVGPNLSAGSDAYKVIPAGEAAGQVASDYRIGALDALDVTVFQEPELSSKGLQVDASGRVAFPLVGSVEAKGKTASQIARELEQMYAAKYLKDPQVTVTVSTSVSQKVSIQGEVAEPGVYPLNGPTTLLDVISMAKGETEVASLNQIVVFRNVNGQRMGAVFDVASIRRGESDDPVIQGNDLVVVGYSAAGRFWRNVRTAAPLLNVFRPVL